MLKYLFGVLLIVFISCNTQKEKTSNIPTVVDVKLALKDIYKSAQKYRSQIPEVRKKYNNLKSLEEQELWKKQTIIDSINMDKVEEIIAKYGYPGKELVGDSLKQVAASVIMQNPKRQALYVDLIWHAAKSGNIKLMDAAFLEDRVLMFGGKNQKYGTSMKYDTISIDKNTKFAVTKLKVWPIDRPDKVDSLRFTIGLYPLFKQCEMMNIDIKTVKGYNFRPMLKLK
ncbi:MAG TPA: DUF6624 domain-containing protein [Saprospiraceae bacterium]|nr:DUF6624 domain-containing protein [Saprospiraceae bacterium]